VIFLPKPAKADYADPRSFRPITLSSFILKTLERLVLWHIQDTALRLSPLSRAQTGFRKGHSTELAITRLTHYVEEARRLRSTVVGLFMDIKGAFDNVPMADLLEVMARKGIPDAVCTWYGNLLKTRTTFAHSDVSGAKLFIQHSRGVPQGGILSPTMWNIFFDPLLEALWNDDNMVIGYADDLCVLQTHRSPMETMLKSQAAIRIMEQWSQRTKLEFCKTKSEYITFNWGRVDLASLPTLTMLGRPMPRTQSVTYLGMRINDTLNWWPHIQEKAKTAKFLLRKSNDIFGRLWGPSPTMIKWSLDAVVAPKVLYGSHVWHDLLSTQKLQDTLRTVNRLGIISMAPCRLHTPSRGLEVVLGATPLHLRAAQKNALTLTRFRLHHPDTPLTGHLAPIYDYMAQFGLADYPLDDIPATKTTTMFRTYINVELPENLSQPQILIPGSCPRAHATPVISVYTDGSKLDGKSSVPWGTGAGYAIFTGLDDLPVPDHPPVIQGKANLCHSFTVFLAEISAIDLAIRAYHKARKEGLVDPPPAIVVFSDSQAALRALSNQEISSKTVLRCKNLLNATAIFTPVHLKWVKAHASSHRNNWVDLLAKEGATVHEEYGPHPRGIVPLSFLKSTLKTHVLDQWTDLWSRHPTCRQTKLWFPGPNLGLSRKIINLSREDIGKVIRWLTGHNFLRRHSQIVDPLRYQVAACRLCGDAPESASHVLADCMALDYHRLEILKTTHLTQPYVWDLHKLLRFIEPFAELLEDTEAPTTPLSIRTPTGYRVLLVDSTATPGTASQDLQIAAGDRPDMNDAQ